MKIVVFENELNNIKGAFNALNIIYYGGGADIKIYPKFQDGGGIAELLSSDFIFIDIDLAPKSQMDGFEIIKLLIDNSYPLEKMAVLTGHLDMRTRLTAKGILSPITIVTKPTTYKALFSIMPK